MFQISTCSPTDPLLKAPWLKLDVDTKQDYERLRALPITITSPTSAIIKSAHEAWERDEKLSDLIVNYSSINADLNDVYLIAEAGVNHEGSIDQALRLVDAAAEAGADAITFQT